MKHELPQLPFDMEALSPVMSKETLEYHWGKHHRAYVDHLNKLIQGTPLEDSTLEQIVLLSGGKVFNNAAQAWNHAFFWNCLRPIKAQNARTSAEGKLLNAIQRDFGSVDGFKENFAKAGVELFGSGWVWLCKDSRGALGVVGTSNAENPLRMGMVPLLVVDVWEHAYYIDYRNARAKFLESCWQIIRWEFVERCFEKDLADMTGAMAA